MSATLVTALRQAAGALRSSPYRRYVQSLVRRAEEQKLVLSPEETSELTRVITGLVREIELARSEAQSNMRTTTRALAQAIRVRPNYH